MGMEKKKSEILFTIRVWISLGAFRSPKLPSKHFLNKSTSLNRKYVFFTGGVTWGPHIIKIILKLVVRLRNSGMPFISITLLEVRKQLSQNNQQLADWVKISVISKTPTL